MDRFDSSRSTHSRFGIWRIQLMGTLFLAIFLSSCGVKTNPVPPHFAPPAPVEGLLGELENGRVTLTWQAPVDGPPGTAVISGFRVMRAKASILDEPCEDCLPRFFQVRDMAMLPGLADVPEGQEMMYSETLDPGFKYQFKVVTYSENGVEGADSNIVTFDYQK